MHGHGKVFIFAVAMGKITIIDVAKLAGVSKGTVDRVLHNRGEVSKKSEAKVLAAIDRLKFEPNLHASMLATKREMSIACLLPVPENGEYWDKVRRGCIMGGEELSSLGVDVRLFLYDQYDDESFRRVAEEMLASSPVGVILPPMFRDDTRVLTERLRALRIPYVYIDSRIEDDGCLAYFGMPSYRSGVLAAHLLTERCPAEEVCDILCVRLLRDKSGLSDPTQERRAGFVDYIGEHFPDCRIHNVFIPPHDRERTSEVLDAYALEHPDTRLAVVFSSRVHLIADWLSAHPVPGRRVIGYDDLDKNLDALRSGAVSVLIGQHMTEYAKQAVMTVADFALKHKQPLQRDNFVHMDILTPYNI